MVGLFGDSRPRQCFFFQPGLFSHGAESFRCSRCGVGPPSASLDFALECDRGTPQGMRGRGGSQRAARSGAHRAAIFSTGRGGSFFSDTSPRPRRPLGGRRLETPNEQGRNTSHSYKAFEYALRAANLLGDADWALELLQAANQVDKGSPDFDHEVVEVLLKTGRLEEAREILEVSANPASQIYEALREQTVGWKILKRRRRRA